jgi:hypothetical protein
VSVCVFIFVGGIERFVVLDVVEAMVERLKLDSDLRQELNEAEVYIRSLKTMLADVSTEGDIFPINAHTMLGDSDTGAWS